MLHHTVRNTLLLPAILLATAAPLTAAIAGGEAHPEKTITAGLASPQRVAASPSDELVVVDSRARGLVVLGLHSGEVVSRIPYAGVAGVGVDWQNRLLVGGKFGARVIDRDGNLVRELVPDAGPLTATDVAVDRNGQRYAVLYGSVGQVVVYDAQGTSLLEFGTGEFLTPLAIAVGPAGEIAVGDTGHGQVKVFDPSGGLLRAFGSKGSAPGQFRQLAGLAIAPSGLIYTSDSFQSWVQVFDSDGGLLNTLGTYGSDLGEFRTPIGLALSDGQDRLVVASLNSGSLQVFTLGAEPPGEPAVTLAPQTLHFGDQTIGTPSAPQSVSLTNSGTAPLAIASIVASGEFTQTHNCGVTLGVGESCVIAASFAPAQAAAAGGLLTIVDNAAGSPRTVPLDGNGTAPDEIDQQPPVVLGITAMPATRDFQLAEEEVTPIGPTQLLVVFDEPMSAEVTDPSNYLILRDGGDGVVDTQSCGDGVDSRDARVTVDRVAYDAGVQTASIMIDGGLALPRGSYALLVCAVDSIADAAGNPLDGDRNGSGGDDFVRHFRVGVTNLLRNPYFDRDLSYWLPVSSQPAEIGHASSDADGVLSSGSAEMVNLTGPEEEFGISQCLAIDGGEGDYYAVGGRVRVESSNAGAPIATVLVEFFSEADCAAGTQRGAQVPGAVAGDTAALWSEEVAGIVAAPPGTASVRVTYAVTAGSSADFGCHFDHLFFSNAGIFVDGFEAGDARAWSSSVPQ